MLQRYEVPDGSIIGLAATLAALGAAPVAAESTASNLGVTATILPQCAISLDPVAFGALNLPGEDGVDAAGSLSVNCTKGTRWSASADRGTGQGASLVSRRLSSDNGQITYGLYLDSGRSRIWGDGSGATATFGDVGSGASQAFPIYGRIAPGQGDAVPGDYSDLVVVTVTY